MRTSILIVTGSADFGDLVCQALRETDAYDVHGCSELFAAISLLKKHPESPFAILDTALGDRILIDIAKSLRKIKWDLNIVLVANDEDLARFDEIQPWKQLRKPFLLSDLLEILGSEWPTVINLEPIPVPDEMELPWMRSPNHASLILDELTHRSDIREAILIRDHQVWASTGHLKQTIVQDINRLIDRQMNFEKNYDLFRYVRFDTVRQEFGLYAKFILFNAILALIFDLVTPTNRMRQHANLLADRLARPLLSDREDPTEQTRSAILNGNTQNINSLLTANSFPASIDYKQVSPFYIKPPTRSIPEPSKQKTGSFYFEPDLFRGNMVTFSGLMTPRFETQDMRDNLIELLYRIFPQICVAYGWRLWSLEIYHECIQWIADVPISLSALEHVQIVKKATSEFLIDENAAYMSDNLSGDFWASGFLVTGGKHHYSGTELDSFLRKIRISSTRLQ